MRYYAKVIHCPMGRPPDRIYIKEFIQFGKAIAPEVYENSIKDTFYYLYREMAMHSISKDNDEEKQFVTAEDLGRRYDEYIAEQENLKGVLSIHTLKSRNYELHQKVAYWKSTLPNQPSACDRIKLRTEFILEKIQEFINKNMISKVEIEQQQSLFYDLLDRRKGLQWEFKTIMKFLSMIPQSGILSLGDLKRYLENRRMQKSMKISLVRTFILQVRQRCSLDGQSFSFFDIPDLILHMKYNKNEYDLILKYVNKLKELFLESKRANGKIDQVTDEDMVPFSLLDATLTKVRHDQEEKKECLVKFVNSCEKEVEMKKAKLTVTKERIMNTIENNILIGYVNSYAENLYTEINLNLYIIKGIYNWLSSRSFIFRINEFLNRFGSYLSLTATNPDFMKINTNELDKFNQKKKFSSDNASDKTDLSQMIGKERDNTKGGETTKHIDKDLEDAIDALNEPNKRMQLSSALKIRVDQDENIAELTPREDAKAQKEIEEEENNFFKSNDGESFNPNAKFGSIENDYTEYEPHMTKYEAVLPTEFYAKTINEQNPGKREK